MNLVVPEGTDTETVTDMSVIVITEQTFDAHITQIKRCRAFTYASCVSGLANGEKKSGGL